MQIRCGVPIAMRAPAAELFWLAFAPQLRPLGSVRAGQAWLRKSLRCPRVVAVTGADGALLGVAGMRDADGGVLHAGAGPMRRVWGARGGRARMRLMRFWRAGPATPALVIDGLAVAPSMRGRGVGGLLVAALAAEARAQGRSALQVEVAASNRHALGFYRRAGFFVVKTPPVGWLWAARGVVMQRPVPPYADGAHPQAQPNMPAARASSMKARAERV